MDRIHWRKVGFIAGCIAAGAVATKVLTSDRAKKIYTNATAVALRTKDSIMTEVSKIKEEADDIVAEAKDLNEQKAKKENEIIEDTSKENQE